MTGLFFGVGWRRSLAGGSADSWKYFDQIQLILLFLLLALAGFPRDILQAYKSFHSQVVYHNTVAGGWVFHIATPVVSLKGALSP